MLFFLWQLLRFSMFLHFSSFTITCLNTFEFTIVLDFIICQHLCFWKVWAITFWNIVSFSFSLSYFWGVGLSVCYTMNCISFISLTFLTFAFQCLLCIFLSYLFFSFWIIFLLCLICVKSIYYVYKFTCKIFKSRIFIKYLNSFHLTVGIL